MTMPLSVSSVSDRGFHRRRSPYRNLGIAVPSGKSAGSLTDGGSSSRLIRGKLRFTIRGGLTQSSCQSSISATNKLHIS
jgi:hypothetical protein